VAAIPTELLPATTILDEMEKVPTELRTVYQRQWRPGDRKYQRERRLCDLTHQLKAAEGVSLDPLSTTGKFDILPDEDI
jgi:hypothetical protein